MPGLTPYTASLRLGSSVGTKGIEVVGATRSLRIDVPALAPVKHDQPVTTQSNPQHS